MSKETYSCQVWLNEELNDEALNLLKSKSKKNNSEEPNQIKRNYQNIIVYIGKDKLNRILLFLDPDEAPGRKQFMHAQFGDNVTAISQLMEFCKNFTIKKIRLSSSLELINQIPKKNSFITSILYNPSMPEEAKLFSELLIDNTNGAFEDADCKTKLNFECLLKKLSSYESFYLLLSQDHPIKLEFWEDQITVTPLAPYNIIENDQGKFLNVQEYLIPFTYFSEPFGIDEIYGIFEPIESYQTKQEPSASVSESLSEKSGAKLRQSLFSKIWNLLVSSKK